MVGNSKIAKYFIKFKGDEFNLNTKTIINIIYILSCKRLLNN